MIGRAARNPRLIRLEISEMDKAPAFKMVSADSHVVEPPDLWVERVDRAIANARRVSSASRIRTTWCAKAA